MLVLNVDRFLSIWREVERAAASHPLFARGCMGTAHALALGPRVLGSRCALAEFLACLDVLSLRACALPDCESSHDRHMLAPEYCAVGQKKQRKYSTNQLVTEFVFVSLGLDYHRCWEALEIVSMILRASKTSLKSEGFPMIKQISSSGFAEEDITGCGP